MEITTAGKITSTLTSTIRNINERAATNAFNKQAAIFDELYSSNIIIQYKRKRVRDHLLRYLHTESKILELNAGTGEDAIWFAENGHTVHATDISTGMQSILKKKIEEAGQAQSISTELCSFTQLENLQDKGPYDHIFSNFAGLNCTGELDKVLHSFSPLLESGGIVTLVILPKFCLWETLLFFKGRFKAAFRRFFSKNGVKAHIEGEYFTCWYYNPSFIIKKLKKDFTLLSVEGLCTIVPPSYLENFPKKFPSIYNRLVKMENKWKSAWPWKSIGDYYIISLQKKS